MAESCAADHAIFRLNGTREQIIARGGLVALPPVNLPVKKQRLPAFTITKEALEQDPISPTSVTITEFGRTINAQIDPERMEKLKTASLLEYLDRHGFLEMRPLPNGKSTRQPTQTGLQLGIGLEERQHPGPPSTAGTNTISKAKFWRNTIWK